MVNMDTRRITELTTDQLFYLRFLEMEDTPQVLEFYSNNQEFLQPWEAARPANFLTLDYMEGLVANTLESAQLDQSYSLGLFLKASPENLVGRINLSNVSRGISQSANLGYALSEAYNGQGFMTTAVGQTVRLAFVELGLHRLAAATLLHNYGSMRVLEKNGFRREGLAQRYLKINDCWQDHYLFAITSEEKAF